MVRAHRIGRCCCSCCSLSVPVLDPCVWLRLFCRFSEGAGASRMLSPKASAGAGLAAARSQIPSVRPKRAPGYMKPQIVLSNWKAHSAAITYVSRSLRVQVINDVHSDGTSVMHRIVNAGGCSPSHRRRQSSPCPWMSLVASGPLT